MRSRDDCRDHQNGGRFNLDHRIDIETEDGQVLDTVWFRDVVNVESSDA
jgi:hypothetical protein